MSRSSARPGTTVRHTGRALASDLGRCGSPITSRPAGIWISRSPFEVLKVVDYGDAVYYPCLTDQAHDAIRTRVSEVASRKIVPFVIGGDHSITYPSATAVADAYGRGKVGLVHFDAHADTGNSTWGNLASHATPMRRLIESGAIPGRNFVQIGLRGYWPELETFA